MANDKQTQKVQEFLESINFFETGDGPSRCCLGVNHTDRINQLKAKASAMKSEIRLLEAQRSHVHRLYHKTKSLRLACLVYSAHRLVVAKFREYQKTKWQLKYARKAKFNHEMDDWILNNVETSNEW